MNKFILFILISVFIAITTCNEQNKNAQHKGNYQVKLDLEKRNKLIDKYDLMNFHTDTIPKLVSVDDFFEGNSDEGSIAPNLTEKPSISEFYKVLKQLETEKSIRKIRIRICDVNIYEDNKLNDYEWPFTEYIYFATNLSVEELKQKTKIILPDEINIETDTTIIKSMNINPEEKLIYIWWD